MHTAESSTWFLDSAASNHFTNDLNNLNTYQPYLGTDQVTVGNGSTLPILHTGNGILPTPTVPFTLNNLFHVPSISSNLLSVHQFIVDNKCTITLDVDIFVIQDKLTKKVLYKGGFSHGLYHLPASASSSLPASTSSLSSPPVCLHCSTEDSAHHASLWHSRLGHPSSKKLNSLVSNHHLPTMDATVVSNKLCTHC